jgi:hypothetical protein
MVAGADNINDLNLVRHGGMACVFAGVYAPSTLGSFLRAFSHGHVRQVQSAGRELLVQLASRTAVLAGADQVMFVDVDSMLRRCYGKKTASHGAPQPSPGLVRPCDLRHRSSPGPAAVTRLLDLRPTDAYNCLLG